MNSSFAISLIIAHFIGDWYLQSRDTALKKSTIFMVLYSHVFTVSCVLLPVVWYFNGANKVWILIPNGIIHGLIDWNIWTYYKKKLLKRVNGDIAVFKAFAYWKDKTFYDTVALDQCLHLVTLFALCSI